MFSVLYQLTTQFFYWKQMTGTLLMTMIYNPVYGLDLKCSPNAVCWRLSSQGDAIVRSLATSFLCLCFHLLDRKQLALPCSSCQYGLLCHKQIMEPNDLGLKLWVRRNLSSKQVDFLRYFVMMTESCLTHCVIKVIHAPSFWEIH